MTVTGTSCLFYWYSPTVENWWIYRGKTQMHAPWPSHLIWAAIMVWSGEK